MTSLATDKPKDYSTFLNNVKKALQLGAEVTELPGRETEETAQSGGLRNRRVVLLRLRGAATVAVVG